MRNRDNQPGPFNLLTVALAAIAISAGAVLLMPAEATSRVSAAGAAGYAGPSGYFPDQYVNRAKAIEPMPMMYE